MDISFIIVNYQSKKYLQECINSLKKNISDLSWEIIVVNNDSEELESFSEIDNIKIINHCINEGFAKSCNMGARASAGEILFFLNPDTELLTSNISMIKKFLDNNKDVAIVAPRLVTQDNKEQEWSAGFEVTLWDILKNNFGLMASKHLWTVSCDSRADWVSGAALAIRKSIFEKISGFDESFFMYFEDVDLCKRVSMLGAKINILPEVKFLHIGSQSFSNTKKQKKLYYVSQDYYFKKYFGVFQLFLLRLLRDFSLILKR